MLLEPKTIKIVDGNGKEKEYTISKFPAIQGREIMAKYPIANMPKLGDYAVSEEVMLKLMKFVAVDLNGLTQQLESSLLVNNHVSDWEALARLETAMIEYNCSFFRNGWISNFFQEFTQTKLPKILKTLMDSLAQSSPTEKQP